MKIRFEIFIKEKKTKKKNPKKEKNISMFLNEIVSIENLLLKSFELLSCNLEKTLFTLYITEH